MKEKPKHIDAFQFWFGLTEKGYSTTDSVKTTAKHCGVIPRTIWKWYKEFGWEDRADKKRLQILAEVEKKENRTLVENRLNYLKILHKILDQFIKDGFPVKIESMKDLDIIIKNCLVLQDAPSEVIKQDTVNLHVGAESLFDEELMKKIIEEEKEARKLRESKENDS